MQLDAMAQSAGRLAHRLCSKLLAGAAYADGGVAREKNGSVTSMLAVVEVHVELRASLTVLERQTDEA